MSCKLKLCGLQFTTMQMQMRIWSKKTKQQKQGFGVHKSANKNQRLTWTQKITLQYLVRFISI